MNKNYNIFEEYENTLEKIFDKKNNKKQSISVLIKNAIKKGDTKKAIDLFNKQTDKQKKSILASTYRKLNYNSKSQNLMTLTIYEKNYELFNFFLEQSIFFLKHNNEKIYNQQINDVWQSILATDSVEMFNILKTREDNISSIFKIKTKIEALINKKGKKSLFYLIQAEAREQKQNKSSIRYNYPLKLLKHILSQNQQNNQEKQINEFYFKEKINYLNKEDIIEFKDITTQFELILNLDIKFNGFLEALLYNEKSDISSYINDCISLTTHKDIEQLKDIKEAKNLLYNQLFIRNIKEEITGVNINYIFNSKSRGQGDINIKNNKYFFHFYMLAFQKELSKNNFNIDSEEFLKLLNFDKEKIKEFFPENQTLEQIPISIIYDMIGLEEEKKFLLTDNFLEKQHNEFLEKWRGLYLIINSFSCHKFYDNEYYLNHNTEDLLGLFIQSAFKKSREKMDRGLSIFLTKKENNKLLLKIIKHNYNSIIKPRRKLPLYITSLNEEETPNLKNLFLNSHIHFKNLNINTELVKNTRTIIETIELEKNTNNTKNKKHKKIL